MYPKQVPEGGFSHPPELGQINTNIHDESCIHITDQNKNQKSMPNHINKRICLIIVILEFEYYYYY